MRTHWQTRSGTPVAHLGVPSGLAPTTNHNKMKRKAEVHETPWARPGEYRSVTDASVAQLFSHMRGLEASTYYRVVMVRNCVVVKKGRGRKEATQRKSRETRTTSAQPRQPAHSHLQRNAKNILEQRLAFANVDKLTAAKFTPACPLQGWRSRPWRRERRGFVSTSRCKLRHATNVRLSNRESLRRNARKKKKVNNAPFPPSGDRWLAHKICFPNDPHSGFDWSERPSGALTSQKVSACPDSPSKRSAFGFNLSRHGSRTPPTSRASVQCLRCCRCLPHVPLFRNTAFGELLVAHLLVTPRFHSSF